MTARLIDTLKTAGRAALALALLCSAAGAESGAGTTVMPFLKLDTGPRQLALGGAFTAAADDFYGMRYNPAGLGRVKNTELGGMFYNGIVDTKMQMMGGALPLGLPGFSGAGSPVLGLNFLASQNGDMEWYKLASDGSAIYSGQSRSAGSDMVLAVGYGEKVAENSLANGRALYHVNHYLGFSFKYISSKLPNSDGSDVSAKAFAADGGYIADVDEIKTSFGLSVLNLGTQAKYIDAAQPLPLTVRGGAACRALRIMQSDILFTADALRYIHEGQNRIRAGLEIPIENMAAIRFGYKFMEDTGGLTAGFGAAWEGFRADFGVALNSTFENVYQFGLTYSFGKSGSGRRGKSERVFLDSGADKSGRGGIQRKAAPKQERKAEPRKEKVKPDDQMLLY